MRGEILFILLVIVVLFALTAIRYRKQIAGMIGLARMLRQVKKAAKEGAAASLPVNETKPNTLVNCSKCDIWVPQNKAVKFREGFICSHECQNAKAPKLQKPARK